ncbi:hypothetical protein EV421DRAFT_1782710 [Armillaria borealis]|uniref:Uncharacterized protein n=1 Tax=Armillaria borealis TaxID=47425 RepID=A0AA39JTZ2_9AGAR|nr:hypothetical protein EV421DRAFT_1782710 [Armillaria borealis]
MTTFIGASSCPACSMNKNLNHYDRLVSTTDFSLPVNLAPFINGNILPTPAVRIEIYQSLRRLETNATCFEEIFAHQQTAISQITQTKQLMRKHVLSSFVFRKSLIGIDMRFLLPSVPCRMISWRSFLGLRIPTRLSWAYFLGLQQGRRTIPPRSLGYLRSILRLSIPQP